MEVNWHFKKVREMVAWMKDETQKTNDPEEIKLWKQGIEMGNDLMQLLKDILKMQK